MNVYFGLLFCLYSTMFVYAGESVRIKNNWRVEDCHISNEFNEGWILEASKGKITKELHFHCKRIQILKETNNCIVFKDIGITRSSATVFVVFFGQLQPYMIYQSPEIDLPTETDVDLIQVYESDNTLSIHIKLFDKRNPDRFIIIKNTIDINEVRLGNRKI